MTIAEVLGQLERTNPEMRWQTLGPGILTILTRFGPCGTVANLAGQFVFNSGREYDRTLMTYQNEEGALRAAWLYCGTWYAEEKADRAAAQQIGRAWQEQENARKAFETRVQQRFEEIMQPEEQRHAAAVRQENDRHCTVMREQNRLYTCIGIDLDRDNPGQWSNIDCIQQNCQEESARYISNMQEEYRRYSSVRMAARQQAQGSSQPPSQ